MLLVLTLLALLCILSLSAADHSVCGWTGPGPGDPTRYNFTLWCWAHKYEILPRHSRDPNHAKYFCSDTKVKVADWNYLGGTGSQVLELATPCNHHGYALHGHLRKHCPFDNWSVCLAGGNATAAITQCFYLTAYNDCAWPGTFTLESLPQYLGVFTL